MGDLASTVDEKLGKGFTDGQNVVRSAFSADLGHLAPGPGDAIPAVKEGLQETNKAFVQDDEQKPFDEQDRS
ncbi:hypothetical protein IQ251_08570 [Saccharopolyspora sp. HNM0983]|uniref:Uncharacterized protein n=1 Tax=Saccharopolyspora montiporae TaxID=2781240 RepID=A0A929B9W6_9PSEU|nr:hypothetical protein [Saccharopolyspora sp. HNM0983]MBE9374500.1 hypothetical protein [Saccharopolyspora sp. HNM0983]